MENIGSTANYRLNFAVVEQPPDKTADVAQTQRNRPTLTVTITSPSSSAGGPGSVGTPLTLELPASIESLDLHHLADQLNKLDFSPMLRGMEQSNILDLLSKTSGMLGQAILRGGPEYIAANKDQIISQLDGMVANAARLEGQIQSLFEQFSESTYPDMREFLSKLLADTAKIRELASQAKQLAVEGQYDKMMEIADNMLAAATKRKEAADKEATAQIVSGALNIAGGIVGMGVAAKGIKNPALAAAYGPLASSFSAMLGGIGSVTEAGVKLDSTNQLNFEANRLDSDNKKLEARLKMLENSERQNDELKDLIRQLAEKVLKMMDDIESDRSRRVGQSNI